MYIYIYIYIYIYVCIISALIRRFFKNQQFLGRLRRFPCFHEHSVHSGKLGRLIGAQKKRINCVQSSGGAQQPNGSSDWNSELRVAHGS